MFAGIRRLVRGNKGEAQPVRPAGPPTLEQLEPRLLLSADSLCLEPLATLDASLTEPAIYEDLDQQEQGIQDDAPSILLTYFAPSDDTDVAPADATVSDPEDSQESLLDQSLTAPLETPQADTEPVEIPAGTTLTQAELGIETTADVDEATLLSDEQSACLTPVDGQDDISSTDGFPIEARGPPADSSDSLSVVAATTYGEEDQPCAWALVESVSTENGTTAPELPGLQLVDPDISNWQGQIIYLDFDGEQNVTYNGPVTIGPFDVPAFQAPGELAGREAQIMAAVTASLNDLFAGTGVLFTLDRPQPPGSYSTIYVGGDGSWASEYGSFFGLAEQVDIGNLDETDNGFVFTDRLSSLASRGAVYVDLLAHESGHLLGFRHVASFEEQFASGSAHEMLMVGASLDEHIGEISSALGQVLDKIKSLIEHSSALAANLPIIGGQLVEAAAFLGDFRNDLVGALKDLTSADGVTNALREKLGTNGLDILGVDDVKFTDSTDTYTWEVDLGKELTKREATLDFNLGLPGLDLDVIGQVTFWLGWDFDFTFGVREADGFFFDTSSEALKVDFKAAIPDLNAGGRLGFLQLSVQDDSTNPSYLTGSFTADIAGGGDDKRVTLNPNEISTLAIVPEISAKALVDLRLQASIGGFALLRIDFTLDWPDVTDSNALEVKFSQIQLNLGDFLGTLVRNTLNRVSQILGPITAVCHALEYEVDLKVAQLSILDLLDTVADVDPDLVHPSDVQDLRDFCAAIDAIEGLINVLRDDLATGTWIDFGSFEVNSGFDWQGTEKVGMDDVTLTNPTKPPVNQVRDNGGASFLDEVGKTKVFFFPIFEDATNIVKLLLGQDVDLIRYDPKSVTFDWSLEYSVGPVFVGPVPITFPISGGFTLSLDFSFGYDTHGLHTGNLIDGLFIYDEVGPEVSLVAAVKAGVAVGASLDFGLVSVTALAGAEGGLEGTVTADVHNENGDGKAYVDEFLEHPFDLSGKLDFILNLFAEVGLEFLWWGRSHRWTLQLVRVTLLQFGSSGDSEPQSQPTLATLGSDGMLTLNIGKDEDESIQVRAKDANVMVVSALGFAQEYGSADKPVRGIVANGGKGNDTIEIDPSVLVPCTLNGGPGDDLLIGGSGNDKLIGGSGSDTLRGGAGNDVLWGHDDGDGTAGPDDAAADQLGGDDGNDALHGGAGDDCLTGDSGDDSLFGGAGNDTLCGGDGKDILNGGSGDGLLYGGEGDDWLGGGAGADVLVGGGGSDELIGGGANDVLWGDMQGIVSFMDQAGNSQTYDTVGDDTIWGNAGDDILHGGAGNDILFGDEGTVNTSGVDGTVSNTEIITYVRDGDGLDTIYGGAGEDKVLGGGSDDLLIGDDEPDGTKSLLPARDIIIGDGGKITLATGVVPDISLTGGADTIRGNEGNDLIYGCGGDDYIEGNTNDDLICGGRGADWIYGNDGNDTIYGEDDPDVIFGGPDDDWIYGEAGDDILIGDDGDVVFSGGSLVRAEGYGDGGIDFIQGGIGNDIIMGGCQGDTIEGGPGNDILIGDAGIVDEDTGTITASVGSGDGSDTIYGQEGEDKILGGGSGDFLYGFNENASDSGQQRDIIIGDGGTITYSGDRFAFSSVTAIKADSSSGGSDTIQGNEGDDIILAGAGGDTDVQGNAGNDVILGDNGTVNLSGGALRDISTKTQSAGGADTLRGGLGNDIIVGGPDGDWVYGDEDGDILIGDNGAIDGTTAEAAVEGSDGADYIYGEAGEDKILGGGGGDFLYGDDSESGGASGSPGRDVIIGDGGRITYAGDRFAFNAVTRVETIDEASGGNDYLYGNQLSSILVGGTAGDFIYGHDDPDTILGDNGEVELSNGQLKKVDTRGETFGGLDRVEGHDANDVIVGGPNGSSDTIYGHDGDDVILGDNGLVRFDLDADLGTLDLVQSADDGIGGTDVLYGNAGKDIVIGGPGDDHLYGGGEADILIGDEGHVDGQEVVAYVRQSDGSDHIYGEAGEDKILGGGDGDFLCGDHSEGGSPSASPGREMIVGDGGRITYAGNKFAFDFVTFIETIDVSAGGDDRIYGNELSSFLFGGAGDDFLYGHACTDWIVGDNGFAKFGSPGVLIELSSSEPQVGGADTIDAGNGPDVVIGGSGHDTILAGGNDQAKDTVLGDNGRVTFGSTATFDPGEEYSVLSFALGNETGGEWVTGVAGAPGAAADNWNHMVGGGGVVYGERAGEIVWFQDDRMAPGVTIQWGVVQDGLLVPIWCSTHYEIDPDDAHTALFERYLLAEEWQTIGLDIGGLTAHFQSFDVYVYIDGSNVLSDWPTSVLRVSDGQTSYYLNDPRGNTFSGQYVQASSVDPMAPQVGNYVVFAGLSGDGVSIRINHDKTEDSDSFVRPTVAGIQIVGRHYAIDRVETTDPEYGGDDTISTGGGNDVVLGGSGNDQIISCGNPVYGAGDADVVVGDNGRVTFMLGEPWKVYTTSPECGGDDVIFTGNGEDVVLGGSGNDVIDTAPYGPYDNGDIQVISLNFHGGTPEGMITGVAGAVQVGNWNNLLGPGLTVFGDSPGELLLFDDGSVATDVAVEWGYGLDTLWPGSALAHAHEQIVNPGTQNERLFKGYLAESVLGVNLSGLGILGTPYDLYMYFDASDLGSMWCDPRITDGTTTFYANDPDGNTFQGQFVEVTSTSPETAQVGNYVVFRNLTSDIATLRISRVPGSLGAPTLAAIQIVGGADKDSVVIGGDVDRDAVVGDNGVVYWFNGKLSDVKSTDLATGGDDTIRTGDDTDLVIGGAASDVIDGQDGHDVLLGDNGRFLFHEGWVIDLDFSDFNDWTSGIQPYGIRGIILLEDAIGGDDCLEGGVGDDLLYGQFGDDTYVFTGAGLGHDALVDSGGTHLGDRPNDLHDCLDFSLFAGPVHLVLWEEGPQVVNPDMVNSEINLSVVLFFSSAFEDVIGSEFDDFVDGNFRDNVIQGLAGNDLLQGIVGNDEIRGGDGHDVINGGDGDDRLYGDAGNDTVQGGPDDDLMYGGSGDDCLWGSDGNDEIYGQEDNDCLCGGPGNDYLDGGSELDEIYGDEGNDELHGGDDSDTLYGGRDDDVLYGGDGNDFLHGGDENLWISEYGHDTFNGGAGDDVIIGEGGRNTLDFSGATGTVAIVWTDATSGTATDGLGGTDTFYSIHLVLDAQGIAISTQPMAVYRFWSETLGCHFYTISETEKDFILATWPDTWAYEGVAFYAYTESSRPAATTPVYRFWSETLGCHFYTISEAQKDYVLATWSDTWTFEGIAFYAFAEGAQPQETSPVHRFWSSSLGCHFYTISEEQKDFILATWPHTWAYEGTAWYAYSGPLNDVALTADDNQVEFAAQTAEWTASTSDGMPVLAGMELVDANPDNLTGQVIYLDFDGAEEVVYNGPVVIGPFDVPAFSLDGTYLAGQEQAIIGQILANLEQIFAGAGILLTTQKPLETTAYSTVYIGGDDSAFAEYGSFLGLAQQVDIANQDPEDIALVFTNHLGTDGLCLAELADALTTITAHEIGHILGYMHVSATVTEPAATTRSMLELPLSLCGLFDFMSKHSASLS